jgi:nicotinate-nucleotide pyrophosphorylase (carboxylating)
MNVPDATRFILAALDEDLGENSDITTLSTVSAETTGEAQIVAKSNMVVCGQPIASQVFSTVGERFGAVSYHACVADGARVEAGDVVATLKGSLRSVLIGERVALNLMMKLSGISTNTAAHVDAATGGTLRVVDTRKTTPLLRAFEKYAVRCGGASNHRFGLYDGILIKDNHLVAAGGVKNAIHAARSHAHHLLQVEVEVSNLSELSDAIDAGADVVLLDNMDNEMLAEAVAMRAARCPRLLLEASGNMNARRIAEIKSIGLDFVSVGGLIHQAVWTDLSLRITARSDAN